MFTREADRAQEFIAQARKQIDNAIDECYKIHDATGKDDAMANQLIYIEDLLKMAQEKIERDAV